MPISHATPNSTPSRLTGRKPSLRINTRLLTVTATEKTAMNGVLIKEKTEPKDEKPDNTEPNEL